MRNRFVLYVLVLAAPVLWSGTLRAQTSAAPEMSSKPADLSGSWGLDNTKGGIGQSISIADPGGKMRGKEPDIPYMPWSLQKTLSEKPPTGPDNQFNGTTDPWINYCEPVGLFRVYMEPGRTKFVQTPDAVYVLHEVEQEFRIIRLNSKHPDDPDPTYWGDSIGWYENGDTLVVDTIGTNDKTWLDQLGHPHTDKLHLIERYKRIDATHMSLEATIDDPGAYTKPFQAHRFFAISKVAFMANPWTCSVRENNEFYNNTYKPAEDPKK